LFNQDQAPTARTAGEGFFHGRAGLPVIMVTGLLQKGDTAKAIKTGIKEFIVKPFLVEELADKIRSAITRSRSSQ